MIFKEVIKSLTEEELKLVLFVVNELHPPGFKLFVNENILSYYKKDALITILIHYGQNIKPENIDTYNSAIVKIGGKPIILKDDTAKLSESVKSDDESTSQKL